MKRFLYFFRKLRDYQLDGINSKIEVRRAQIFNISLLAESVILFINCLRHFIKGNYNSSLIVVLSIFFLIFLYAIKSIKRTTKYVIAISLGLIVPFVFIHFIDNSKDIIQVYLVTLIATGLFLSGKNFYILFCATIAVYYFTFFNLGYQKIYNPFGALTFIGLALMTRFFVKDAKRNERIINKQVKELKELDTLKTKLFANISHEIRTPLTLILGANENLESAKAPKKHTDSIKSNSNRLLELVNQILELVKTENKKRVFAISKIDFNVFIESQMASFSSLADSKKIIFQNKIDPRLQVVFLDIDAVTKIISNLLGNAFKFSSIGATVFFEAQLTKEYLQLKVTDTGRGISKEELPYIFNQYFYSNVGLEASSGIGLALVNELIKALGGTIDVTSEKNVGSCFTIHLPITIKGLEDNNVNFMIVQKSVAHSNASQSNFKIIENLKSEDELDSKDDKKVLLLVEDNDELREYIKEVLDTEYYIIEAIDGKIGIEKAIEFTPDIIISDIMMPKVDGLELLQQLKKDIRTSHIPIIILTAKANEEDKLKGLEHEADDYLTKPFNQMELLLRLKNRISAQNKMQMKAEVFSIQNFKNVELFSAQDKFLLSIKLLIEKHLLDESFGPDELAKEISLSKSQLLRKIRAITNVPTSIYIRNIRLEFAKEKLINKTATIAEIAYQTGFSSPNYFSKCFKEYTNLTPKEFIENI
ncbi:response regulator [Flavobacterium sp.]|uniref:hybrid sensor histidine kinase/response regulator transcription factor n=1 Tax=Flavobacterium sp. TaxID=239 RepID=UPI0037519EDC